jgi:hypothetical protein
MIGSLLFPPYIQRVTAVTFTIAGLVFVLGILLWVGVTAKPFVDEGLEWFSERKHEIELHLTKKLSER